MPERRTVRLFVAIFPPRAVVERLTEETARVRRYVESDAVRWTAPEQIHLTLNFIGPVESARVAEFIGALEPTVGGHGRFPVRAVGLGCFPSSRQPRILWAGLSGETRVMAALKEEIDQALTPLGYVAEDRAFHPHLTLGRVNHLDLRDRSVITEWMAALGASGFGDWEAERIELMQSVLAPGGASYSVVKAFELREG